MKITPHPDKNINKEYLKKCAHSIYKFICTAHKHNEVPLKVIPSQAIFHSYEKIYDYFTPQEQFYGEKEIYEILFFSECLTSHLESSLSRLFGNDDSSTSGLYNTNSHADLISMCLSNDYLSRVIDDPSPLKNHKQELLDVLIVSGLFNLSYINKLSEDYSTIISKNNIPSSSIPLGKVTSKMSKQLSELQVIKEEMLEICIDSYTYFILANEFKKQNVDPKRSPFSTIYLHKNLDAIKRESNSQGGRTTHARKAKLYEIGEDTWKEYPKLPIAQLAEALLNYDKQKYNDSPSLRAINEWLKVSSYNPKLKGRQPKIEFDLVIK